MAGEGVSCLFEIILVINYDSQILRFVIIGKPLLPYNLQDLTILKLSYTVRLELVMKSNCGFENINMCRENLLIEIKNPKPF